MGEHRLDLLGHFSVGLPRFVTFHFMISTGGANNAACFTSKPTSVSARSTVSQSSSRSPNSRTIVAPDGIFQFLAVDRLGLRIAFGAAAARFGWGPCDRSSVATPPRPLKYRSRSNAARSLDHHPTVR